MDFDTNPESPYWMEELSKARSRIVSHVDRPVHYYKTLEQLYGTAHECLSGISTAQHFAGVERLPFMRRHYRNLEALGKAMFSTRDRDKVIQDARRALDNWHHRESRFAAMTDLDAGTLDYIKRRDEMELYLMCMSLRSLKRIGMNTPESNELLQQIDDDYCAHMKSRL
jgi:hypothetical protein